MSTSRIVFGMTGAVAVDGGIAAANLNVLAALSAFSGEREGRLLVLSLLESDHDRPRSLPAAASFRGFGGRKAAFAKDLLLSYRPGALYVIDHVHLAAPLIPLLALGLGRLVLFAHGSEASRRLRRSSRWLFRRAALCLANSRHTLEKMRQTFAGFAGAECALGLSPRHGERADSWRREEVALALDNLAAERATLGRRMILLVARMSSSEGEKGHFRLLDAWPQVTEAFPDAQLVLTGAGDDRDRIADYARALGVARSVFMPGHVSDALLSALYAHCFAFVMPSLQEGFGLVFLEAMNHAKPCVGCAGDGAESVIVDGVTGCLLKHPGDARELFALIAWLFEHDDEAARMGASGLRRLEEMFTAAHAQQRIVARLSAIV